MKQNNKEKVDLNDLVPPFRSGDWITYHTDLGRNYAPRGQLVWQANETPEFVGKRTCGSGWIFMMVDSSHFRRATTHDIKRAIRLGDKRVQRWTSRRYLLDHELQRRLNRPEY